MEVNESLTRYQKELKISGVHNLIYLAHRFWAACLAISARRSGVMRVCARFPAFQSSAPSEAHGCGVFPLLLGRGLTVSCFARGDIDHAFRPLVQVARALGGLRHIGRLYISEAKRAICRQSTPLLRPPF